MRSQLIGNLPISLIRVQLFQRQKRFAFEQIITLSLCQTDQQQFLLRVTMSGIDEEIMPNSFGFSRTTDDQCLPGNQRSFDLQFGIDLAISGR